MKTSDYVEATCGDVYTKISQTNFENYLDELQEAILDPSEIVKVFARIAEDAGTVAQKWGADTVRDGFRECIVDLETIIEEQGDKIDELEAEIAELKDKLDEV